MPLYVAIKRLFGCKFCGKHTLCKFLFGKPWLLLPGVMKNRQCKNDILLLWLPNTDAVSEESINKVILWKNPFTPLSAWKYGVKSRFSLFHTCVNRLGKFFAPVLFLSPVTSEGKQLSTRLPHIVAPDARQFRIVHLFLLSRCLREKWHFQLECHRGFSR